MAAQALSTNHPLTLLFLDLNDFKAINDTHGHGIGDQLPRAPAAGPRPLGRTSDLSARYGGEEFAVILPDTSRDGR